MAEDLGDMLVLTQSYTGEHNNFIVDFMQSQRRVI